MNIRSLVFLVMLPVLHASAQPASSPPARMDLYILAGQSNMAGRGKVEAIDTVTDRLVWMFTKEQAWAPAQEPLAFDKPSIAGVGPGFAFGKAMAKGSGSHVGLIPTAVGGTRIDAWQPGAYDSSTHTHPYDDAIQRIRAALKQGELKGVIWHQGESDANPRLSGSYEAKLRALINRFRSDLHAPLLPFILGEIGDFKPGTNPDIPVINAIIRKVAASTPACGLANADGLTHKGDFIHFDAASARELGSRYASAMISILQAR